ncbi:MAG: hypothetical protein EBS23_10190, partial [Betaproteobacteria bacterium]|nr:hypothetical protein [Betaproteobacteria bacterium]
THDADDIAFGGMYDLDGNGQPDTCQGAIEYARNSGNLGVPTASAPQSFTFTNLVPTDADVPLTITATGDFDATNEFLTVRVSDGAGGIVTTLGRVFETGGRNCSAGDNTATITLPMATFNAFAAGGQMAVTLLPSPAVTAAECPGGTMSVRLAYLGIGPGGDCDNDARLDVRQIAENKNLDYNRNGNLDFCDCRDNPALDRDRNGVLDVLDCLSDPSIDCNRNGSIDAYELIDDPGIDCNGNGVIDSCDVAGRQVDLVGGWGWNGYGQINTPSNATGVTQVACGGAHTYALKNDGTLVGWGDNNAGKINTPSNLTGVTQQVACGIAYTYALFEGDCDADGVLDSTTVANGTVPDLNANLVPDSCDVTRGWEEDCDTNTVIDRYQQGVNLPYAVQSAQLGPIGHTSPQTADLFAPPFTLSDPVLAVTVRGDFSLPSEFVTIYLNGRFVGQLFTDTGSDKNDCRSQITRQI